MLTAERASGDIGLWSLLRPSGLEKVARSAAAEARVGANAPAEATIEAAQAAERRPLR